MNGDAAIAQPDADPDGDKMLNILEYGLGTSPNTSSTTALPIAGKSAGHATLTFTRNTNAVELTYVVQAADSPAGPWSNIASKIGIDPWTTTSGTSVNDTGTVIVTDAATNTRRFLRLSVTLPDTGGSES